MIFRIRREKERERSSQLSFMQPFRFTIPIVLLPLLVFRISCVGRFNVIGKHIAGIAISFALAIPLAQPEGAPIPNIEVRRTPPRRGIEACARAKVEGTPTLRQKMTCVCVRVKRLAVYNVFLCVYVSASDAFTDILIISSTTFAHRRFS